MKISVLFFLAIVLLPVESVAQFGTLTLNINGTKTGTGVVKIGLFDSSDSFLNYEKAVRGETVAALTAGVRHTFIDLPAGTYAVAVWYDENGNGVLDTNWLGIPKEKYGFSLNKFGMFGPPDFAAVSFLTEAGKEKVLEISLR